MMKGLRPGPLFDSLSKNVLETLSILQSKIDKYIIVKELAEAKRRRRGRDGHKRKEPNTQRADYKDKAKSKKQTKILGKGLTTDVLACLLATPT